MRLRVARSIAVLMAVVMAGIIVHGQDSECEDSYAEKITQLLEDRDWEGIISAAGQAQISCEAASGEYLYRITINTGTNIRDAAGIPSNIVGKAEQGVDYEVFSVTVGSQYTWLEIFYDGETAFVAESLTTRLPDYMLVEGGQAISILGTQCHAWHTTQRHRRISINVAFYDNSDDRIHAEIYKPGATTPVPVYSSDYSAPTEATYQRYSQWWSEGVYTLELEAKNAGFKTVMGFAIDGTKTNFLGINCPS